MDWNDPLDKWVITFLVTMGVIIVVIVSLWIIFDVVSSAHLEICLDAGYTEARRARVGSEWYCIGRGKDGSSVVVPVDEVGR